ncbi:glycosyltransferase family 4 protein [Brevundimonas goettingensis]|uniref:Glycosyltransferase family 4 protein n=1 Tax=Brevundimonas goettingensis TaxID=2774190 RepID=A0A975C0Y5_9CAUL|nr:glycosyltransferase family 4 protein [Brevundimonas goettingensis]QTC91475.1 glycosyltransferase family 4 protein [Brevundimonas goettingensis]
MRIALAHKFYHLAGGAEVFFRETERVLRDQGHETLMIASGEDHVREGADNVLLLDAPDYDSPSVLTKMRSLPSAIYDRGKKAEVKAALEAFRPDVFHAFGVNVQLTPSVVVAADELGLPIVGTFNDYKHICPNYKLFHHGRICMDCKPRRFYEPVLNRCSKDNLALSVAGSIEAYAHQALRIYDRFDHFTFSSKFLARTTQSFWADRDVSWSHLRNPFPSAAYEAQDEYAPYGLYFGRLIEEKGVDRLIRAAALLDGFPIKIVGDGPDTEALKALAVEVGADNVEFLGAKWGAELDEVLRLARFVVVPSIWHENFPYVINQSFAYARPVIGSDRGGITELVEHGQRGLIFDPDNIQELADQMRVLVADEDKARRFGQAAKVWSDQLFTDQIAYADLMSAYEQAHENRRRRR